MVSNHRPVSVRWHGMCELYRGGCRAVPESSEHGWDEAMNNRENRIDRRVRVGLEGAPQVLCVLLHILWVSSGDTVECVFVYKNSTYGMRSLIGAIFATWAHQSAPLWLFKSLQQR